MIIAITGGTGFIGRRLVLRHLDVGDEVRVLTRRDFKDCGFSDRVRLFCGDLSMDVERLREFVDGADVLYHCAAELNDESKMRCLHVDGTRRLLDAAKGNVGRWIQLSSVGVYGAHKEGIITEKTPSHPVGVYETTKYESDELVISAGRSDEISYTIIRPSIVYGKDMPNRSVYQLIGMIRRGFFFFVGDRGASANYIHVDNVVEGMIQAAIAEEARNRIYNLSDHRTIEEFVSIICRSLGRRVPRLRCPEKLIRMIARVAQNVPGCPLTVSRVDALTSKAIYSTDAIANDLSYTHKVSMEEGLASLIKI